MTRAAPAARNDEQGESATASVLPLNRMELPAWLKHRD